jgi:predicted O-linked N-acetylglucosamine transferase (SPINDLY family)
MKTLLNITFIVALVALLASCQTGTDVNKILSNQDTKMAIMDTIANDSNLSVEMMETMMNFDNSKMMMMRNEKMAMMMMQNQGSMLRMMENNPDMMQSMMNGMIETCYRDSIMMTAICSGIMNNPKMMDMIHEKMDGNMGMNRMERVNYKTK